MAAMHAAPATATFTAAATATRTGTTIAYNDHRPSARDPRALLRLCQLVSPALPVGAYAYSQGLEYAVQASWVRDEASALEWLEGILHLAVGTLDLPILWRLYRAWETDDATAVQYWNAQLIAARETAESRDEERHLGGALVRVLTALGVADAADWREGTPAFATMFALAAVRWNIEAGDALCGYLWSWAENQVLAAIKLVPLGQSAGQRMLHRLADSMPAVALQAKSLGDEALGIGVVSQALASALHESQYTRLFRS